MSTSSSFGSFGPTFSPMNSIGASSRSPSPMTIVPRAGTRSKAERIALTAAASADIPSPRPICAEAEIAAASVTRVYSRTSVRSMVVSSERLSQSSAGGRCGAKDAKVARRSSGKRVGLPSAS